MELSKTSKKGDKTRRSWTQREEAVLLSCLKELVASGWKADNGFRVGYLNVLEQNMAKIFPGTDLRATPHINSKIHVWKKDYGTISSILVGRTGVGWNDTTKMIEASEDVWSAVMKVDKNARNMRFKSWPYYDDWCEIFGKDRATGEQAEDVTEAMSEIVNNTKDQEKVMHDIPDSVENEIKLDNSTHQAVDGNIGKKSGGRKRKSQDGNEGFYELLSDFCRSTQGRLGDIASRIGYEQDVSTKREEVFEIVGKVGDLSLQQKLWVSKTLVKNTEELELFLSLPENARAEYVQMMLAGKL